MKLNGKSSTHNISLHPQFILFIYGFNYSINFFWLFAYYAKLFKFVYFNIYILSPNESAHSIYSYLTKLLILLFPVHISNSGIPKEFINEFFETN